MLKFSTGNRKINDLAKDLGLSKKEVVAFDLPAGYTCPAADICKSQANRENGKITDGENCQFRCYAASTESVFTSVRNLRWHNYSELTSSKDMVKLISDSINSKIKVIRIHSSGDFFSKAYFQAWVKVAELHPEVTIFGYTKVLPYVKAQKPENFKLVYSHGGIFDNKVTNEPVSYVVASENQAIGSLPCKDNPAGDFYEIMKGNSFSLLIHGTQPAKA